MTTIAEAVNEAQKFIESIGLFFFVINYSSLFVDVDINRSRGSSV